MGQYWKPVNLDKREYVDPHKLDVGLKLWEQLASHPGTGAAARPISRLYKNVPRMHRQNPQ